MAIALRTTHRNDRIVVLALGCLCMVQLLGWLGGVGGQSAFLLRDSKCEEVDSSGTRRYYSCVGEPLSLLRTNISVFNMTVEPRNATCGDTPQFFCTLGILRTCSYCDNKNASFSHPVSHMIDYRNDSAANLDTYWQSVTWAHLNSRPEVSITLSFNRRYTIEDNIVVTFKSARPQQMILEKSINYGKNWTVLQYYNKNCKQMYDTGTAARAVTISAPDAVICTEAFSGDYPYTDGQVLFDVNSDRYGLFIGETFADYRSLFAALNSTRLPEFLTFTDLRIRLIYPATDGSEALRQTSDLQRFYYGISDISLVAGCHCNLHAKRCVLNSGRMVCDCQHNTEGDSCERCKPLYNNRPWKPGFYLPYPGGTANECQMCQCYNHSTSCTYNQQLGTAHCNACQHNTVGTNCNACASGYYRNSSLPIEHPDVCQPCRCEPLGVATGDLSCGAVDGKCNCRAQVTGRRCDECVDGYYGLLMAGSQGTCKLCSCNLAGTVGASNVCNKQTGQCPCKTSIDQRDCSKCRDGFYNFPSPINVAQECIDCGCDPGGSRNLSCNGGRDSCQCRTFITGPQCNAPQSGYYVPGIDYDSLKPGGRRCRIEYDMVRTQVPYTEREFDLCNESDFTSFPNIVTYGQPYFTGIYFPALRYSLNGTVRWPSATLTITVTGTNATLNVSSYKPEAGKPISPACSQTANSLIMIRMTNLTTGMGQTYVGSSNPITIDVRCSYSTALTLDSAGNASQPIIIDSLVMVPDYKNSLVYQRERSTVVRARYDTCVQQTLSLITRQQTLTDSFCRQFGFSVMAQQFETAFRCNCDPVGTVTGVQCDPVGGQCRCRQGVGGRRCEYCLPGYYNLTTAGCTACNCDSLGSQRGVCDYVTGQCPCYPNVAMRGQLNALNRLDDLRCTACRADYYGLRSGQGCLACNCSSIGRNATSQCSDAGVCPCKATIGGARCDQCLPGYYRFSAEGCLSCNCSKEGSFVPDCHQTTGACSCKANVAGPRCDQCAPSSFDLRASNKDGCQKCFCYGHGTQCTSASGFKQLIVRSESTDPWSAVPTMVTHLAAPGSFLLNSSNAYGQWLNFTVRSSRSEYNVTYPDNTLVYMESGTGRRIFYRDRNFTASSLPRLVSVSLHHSDWALNDTASPIDAFAMSDVLKNLKLLAIQRRFANFYVEISNVSLTTAVLMSGASDPSAIPVTYVENCTCITTRYVAGLSCANCSQGYRRAGALSTLYDSCTACSCNGRTETTPPICNELTGVCVNCRNGTNGNQCQTCASNVTTISDCRQCEFGYWGLAKDGCRPCTCQTMGSMVTAQCETVTGQCQCKQNVAGRDCEKCADNHASMTVTGCTPCDSCYALVGKEVIELRAMRVNLTNVYEMLRVQNNTAGSASFSQRFDTARNNMTQLFLYLTETANLKITSAGDISRLDSMLLSMRRLLTQHIPMSLNRSRTTVDKSVLLVTLCEQTIYETTMSQQDTYRRVTYELPVYTLTLQQLMVNLQSVVNQLKGSSDNTVVGIQNLNNTVMSIEIIAANSSAISTLTYQMTQAAAQEKVQLERAVVQTEQLVLAVNRTAESALTATGTTSTAAQGVLKEARDYQSKVTAMTALVLNTAGLLPSIERDKAEAASITTEAVTAQRNAQTSMSQAYAARGQTNLLVTQVNQVTLQSDAQYSRIRSIEDRATMALARATNISTDVTRMLDIMKNFDKRALDLQILGNASLRLIPQITSSSQQALNKSAIVEQSLQPATLRSAEALKTFQEAVQIANTTANMMSSTAQRSDQLFNESSKMLNDIDAKMNFVRQTNSTLVAPLASGLVTQTAQITTVETTVNSAKNAAANATTLIQGTQTRVEQLLRQLQAAEPVASTGISQLQIQAAQVRADYDRMGLRAMVTQLSKTVSDQKTWLDNMKKRRDDLAEQIARLRLLQQRLVN